MLQKELIIKALNKVVYIILLCVGIYFIYEGDIVQKFRLKRTNFAVALGERLAELPTILTFVHQQSKNKLKLGIDFNISYHILSVPMIEKPLKLGSNIIDEEKNLEIDFETLTLGGTDMFKITHTGGQFKLEAIYGLSFSFKNSTVDHDKTSVTFRLGTENSSVNADSQRVELDGELLEFGIELGRGRQVIVEPHRYHFLEELEECRHQSYNQLLFTKLSKINSGDCKPFCRPKKNYGKSLNKLVAKIPICNNRTEKKCFGKAKDDIRLNILVKPCTKVRYKLSKAGANHYGQENMISFHYSFAYPTRVVVHQEYLLYDTISMIGAVGGILGLCIGFSFSDFFELISSYFAGNAQQPNKIGSDENIQILKNQMSQLRRDLIDIKLNLDELNVSWNKE